MKRIRPWGKAFPSLLPRRRRVIRYPFQRGTPPWRPRTIATAITAAMLLSSPAVGAGKSEAPAQTSGPAFATVRAVIDGDTLWIEPLTWFDRKTYTRVRFEMISAPETGGRAKCLKEIQLGQDATDELRRQIRPGDRIHLYRVRPGRYPGRLIADVRMWNGEDPAFSLLQKGLAVPFYGSKRADWCSR
jgi:micrococcal nuclease